MALAAAFCYSVPPPSGLLARQVSDIEMVSSLSDATMKLAIDRLTGKPSEHRYDATAAWWAEWTGAAEGYAYTVVALPSFVVAASAAGDDVTLHGTVQGEIEVECSRCLKRYGHALSDTFHLVLEPIRDRKPPDPESRQSLERFGLCLGDELEVGWYRGKEVGLDPVLAEVTALAMPIQPLCREDCAGLCPQCGIDRSQASCDCTDTKPDSPFAALAALRDEPDGSS